MKLVLQRVTSAQVQVNQTTIAQIDRGLVLFICFVDEDVQKTEHDFKNLIGKICKLRLFKGSEKPFDISLNDINGELLIVSQFTLAGSLAKGLRPSFINSLKPDIAKAMYEKFLDTAHKLLKDRLSSGEFGADMEVSLVNEGPATFILDF